MTYQSINPFDGKTLRTFEETTDEALEEAVETAATCYETWRHKSFAERAAIVGRVAALMQQKVEALAHTMTLEMGKRIDEARGEVKFSAKILAYYGKRLIDRVLADRLSV
jgi:succinate-semialdehyde dehydrogenase/glutarate-semialdehyde dehydrogenase